MLERVLRSKDSQTLLLGKTASRKYCKNSRILNKTVNKRISSRVDNTCFHFYFQIQCARVKKKIRVHSEQLSIFVILAVHTKYLSTWLAIYQSCYSTAQEKVNKK